MTRIFQSSWLTALLGCLLYLGTTIALIRPGQFANAKATTTELSANDDPSWKFKNPEIEQWISEIKGEKEKLSLREQQLNEWQARLDAERQEISTVTTTVTNLQSDFDNNVIRFKAQEAENIKHEVKLIAAMSPAGAIAMLNEMSDDDVVKILFTMKTDIASAILDTMSKSGKADAKRAATFTERLHQVLPPATNSAVATAP